MIKRIIHLILNYNCNINNKDSRKSVNLINNIRSLSILSNNDLMVKIKENIKSNEDKFINNEEDNFKFRPIITEENILFDNNKKNNNVPNNIINKSISHKELAKNANKKNTTIDNSNTYDNSNSYFNTNNISNNHSYINNNHSFIDLNFERTKNNSKILNSSHTIYIKKNYSQNLIMNNNPEANEDNTNDDDTIVEIPLSKKYIKSKDKKAEFNNININWKCNKKASSFCLNPKLKFNIHYERNNDKNSNEEDINDSDDDGIINIVNNFRDKFKDVNNKENINILSNNFINNDSNSKSNRSTITNHSVHSYSVVDSVESFPTVHKNNIFSNAHKKYFS